MKYITNRNKFGIVKSRDPALWSKIIGLSGGSDYKLGIRLKKSPSIFYILLFLLPLTNWGQETELKYVDGKDLELRGRGVIVTSDRFYRLDSLDALNLPKRVQELSRNTAGFNLNFKTDSKAIHLKWRVDEYRSLWNMTPLAVNGFDLYAWNGTAWQFVSSAKPSDIISSDLIIRNLDGELRNYRLYFPLYAGVEEVQVGIDKTAKMLPPDEFLAPIKKAVIYGSSITQGASASRPGMAFPSIISRDLQMEFINLGFSGSGEMEFEVAEILGTMDPDLFILDCVPNPTPEQIRERALPFIRELRRARPDTPILMIESVFRENAHWDSEWNKKVIAQNNAFRHAFETLRDQGYGNLYYLASDELIGDDHEATIDGAHFTDLGHYRIASRISESIRDILSLKETYHQKK